jgi:hypothetical protein
MKESNMPFWTGKCSVADIFRGSWGIGHNLTSIIVEITGNCYNCKYKFT